MAVKPKPLTTVTVYAHGIADPVIISDSDNYGLGTQAYRDLMAERPVTYNADGTEMYIPYKQIIMAIVERGVTQVPVPEDEMCIPAPSIEVPTIEGADGTYYDHATSSYQADIALEDGVFTGTLTEVEGGLSPSGPLSGTGYFLALHLDDVPETATSIKVGLDPSMGTGLVEILGDPDMVVVMKIDNKDTQVFKIIITDGETTTVETYSLSGLTLS